MQLKERGTWVYAGYWSLLFIKNKPSYSYLKNITYLTTCKVVEYFSTEVSFNFTRIFMWRKPFWDSAQIRPILEWNTRTGRLVLAALAPEEEAKWAPALIEELEILERYSLLSTAWPFKAQWRLFLWTALAGRSCSRDVTRFLQGMNWSLTYSYCSEDGYR
jgi:hypothetical protein